MTILKNGACDRIEINYAPFSDSTQPSILGNHRGVHKVKIIGKTLEITYTDGEGHSWFETYNEEQLTDYFKEAMK